MRPVLAVLALSLAMTACGSSQTSTTTAGRPKPAAPSTRAAAVRFLDRYVTSDGRVIRHDQGGDIVSEGQAYAMLIAEVADRPALVRTIWSWTSRHLGRSDGLFASHASGAGQIEDPHSATDADTLIAYALLRYDGPDGDALHKAGSRVAEAVLAHESVSLPDGTALPAAGPWATSTKPPIVDPSYLMPSVFVGLAALTGDKRWNGTADASVNLIDGLTGSGTRLPPDWASLEHDRLAPIANPGGGAGVQYGFDAARLPIWFATACSARAHRIAAGWWRTVLGSDGRAGPQALGLDGNTINPAPSPVFLVAGAAAATAAGDTAAARALLGRATTLAHEDPTYYGEAWLALGPALLEGSINPCSDA
ncbi:MAG TPA: glycosyl hydrolase family 8 [Solirubrobacteraceae bacterium]|nr:glycosyl hydrolase family 8 [Solirubrobacteraceae bacterium]